jgi:hypothetical protein
VPEQKESRMFSMHPVVIQHYGACKSHPLPLMSGGLFACRQRTTKCAMLLDSDARALLDIRTCNT